MRRDITDGINTMRAQAAANVAIQGQVTAI
jgi:hypothetical protein